MPGPSTVKELLALLQRSELLEEKTLARYLHQRRAVLAQANSPAKAATLLVRDRLLTHFQAGQLLQGKWRRFMIGPYKILEPLGSGGMGSVFLCDHVHMRRKVAIKVLSDGKNKATSSLDRFYREARAVAVLDHPNIVRAYDIGQEGTLHYLAMEYVEGSSLQQIVTKCGPVSPLQAVHYLRQAAQGLQHTFQAGVVHRDIKPSNLLVDLTGTVKILDLGLARFYEDEEDDLSRKHDELVLGTADYLSPEQAMDSHQADIRSDIYSLGCTIYFCLCGQPPFPEGTLAQKLIWHTTREPAPIRQLRPEVPEELAAVLQMMMAKARENRYSTPAELSADIAALPMLSEETGRNSGQKTLKERRTKPPKVWRWPWANRRRLWLGVGLGITLLAGLGLALLLAFGR